MRIASTQYHTTMNTALQGANEKANAMLQRMATGQRMLVPSEDPVSQVRLMRLGREEAAIDQYRKNIETLNSRLEQNESHLSNIVNDSMDARDLLVWALNGSNAPEDLKAMVSSFDALRESILYTANTRDREGRYLFSGTAIDTAPIRYDPAQPVGSRYTFAGNTQEQAVAVGSGVTQPANVSLPEVAALLNHLEQAGATMATSGVNVNDPAVRATLTAALDGLDASKNSIDTQIARQGGRRNILEALDGNHADVSLSNQTAALTIAQLDYGDAAVKLNGYTLAVEATQKAYAKVSGLSLFNLL
ncbi:flagellar hook-associated protein FlgL [Paracidovorax anthurii]|uniref:Flagellar hook-associated protein 3 FlgL n=1 Tax=Paracidovorax anthurii TaxID=78229 RepID=A0A328Z3J1_9BURK|nr:flagellar hook-associated protein FlgL [Paracidovorax anthurii]RAR76826.1 flagellar hook-associated protein 3 FlgL [Paracidovorax anthurii]